VKKFAIVIATAALLLTGCSADSDDGRTGAQAEADTEEAINDAIGVDVTAMLTAQVIGSWDTMVTEADRGCVASLTGATVDPVAFNAAADVYDLAYADLTLDDGGPAPAGYPATAPNVDTGDWCAAATVLKAAR
jgi:hypothetical protein